jgi:hypothetical protein
MMSEEFFDQVDWFTEKFGGERLQTDEEIVNRFGLHGPEYRIAILNRIEGERDGSELGLRDLRKAGRIKNLTKRMNDQHQLALKACR